ncbi:Probable elongator complex protein 2 [Sergentomyia squamirostris]
MEIKHLYTSAACNKSCSAVDWNIVKGVIAFGTCNSVAIAENRGVNVARWQIVRTLSGGHRGHVNAVKWLKCTKEDEVFHLISASDDGTVILWTFRKTGEAGECPEMVILGGETKCGVSTVDGEIVGGKLTIAAGLKDALVEIWHPAEKILSETIKLGKGYPLVVRMETFLDKKSLLLLVGTSESKINLYVRAGGEDFQLKKILVGHADWIRGIDATFDGSEMVIATSGQDNYIRLWRLSQFTKSPIGGLEEESNHLEKMKFQHEEETYQVELESVLKGHEGWVYSVQLGRTADGNLQLLSASIDKSLVIWTQSDGLWLEDVRLGDFGGNQMGFLTGRFGADCTAVLTHNFQGCLQIWEKSEEIWTVSSTFGGHFGAVREISWEPLGEYLLSVSADQTTRIHAQWTKEGVTTWHEIGRPQIHGYDLQAIVPLSRFKFLSAAEEKIIRCFEAPTAFGRNFKAITDATVDEELENLLDSNVAGVTISALGLSAKAPDAQDQSNVDELQNKPPSDEFLKSGSLWIECQKLYGHGYDVYALDVSPDRHILASSCKASNPEHSRVILWDTKTWQPLQHLPAHQLTVTQIRFSPDNQKLLLVSRDRRFSLFERDGRDGRKFTCTGISDKKNGIHARIIWCCGWSHDSDVLATGSRDGKLVAWRKTEVENGSLGFVNSLAVQDFTNESVTSLAFAPELIREQYFVAVGFESGRINLCSLSREWSVLCSIPSCDAHSLTVQSVKFRPGKNHLELASCGDDHLVRIFDLAAFRETQ